MVIELAGGASTNSRMSRPLPRGVVSAKTLAVYGAEESVEFTYEDGHTEDHDLLSWVIGQAGLLWGGGPFPDSVQQALDDADHCHGSYGHAAEHELAQTLGDVFDGHLTSDDMSVRFFSNGGDACAAAVRVARESSVKENIATQGYHGAQTDFAHVPQCAGYPYVNVVSHNRFEFGHVEAMRSAAVNAACIMVEVPSIDDDAEVTLFLRACRDTADEYHIPFIIDDVVGGFRFGLAGTAGRYGVNPDMICLGKAMSATGGISALIGRRDLVGKFGNGDVFYSTTFGGAPDKCAAANATIKWLMKNEIEVYGGSKASGTFRPGDSWTYEYKESEGHLRKIGRLLKDGLKEIGVPCVGQAERTALVFDNDADWLSFCSQMIERGIMMHRPNFVTLAHTETHVKRTLEAAAEVMKDWKK